MSHARPGCDYPPNAGRRFCLVEKVQPHQGLHRTLGSLFFSCSWEFLTFGRNCLGAGQRAWLERSFIGRFCPHGWHLQRPLCLGGGKQVRVNVDDMAWICSSGRLSSKWSWATWIPGEAGRCQDVPRAGCERGDPPPASFALALWQRFTSRSIRCAADRQLGSFL